MEFLGSSTTRRPGPRFATLGGPYLPWSAGAMRPAGLVAVCNDIVLNDRRRVVELGGGVSTVLVARLLTQRCPLGGFRMAVVEHDIGWARWITDQLNREGIGDEVAVKCTRRWSRTCSPSRGGTTTARVAGGTRRCTRGGPSTTCSSWTALRRMRPGYQLVRYPALPLLRGAAPPARPSSSTTPSALVSRKCCGSGGTESELEFDRRAEQAGVALARIGAKDTPAAARGG